MKGNIFGLVLLPALALSASARSFESPAPDVKAASKDVAAVAFEGFGDPCFAPVHPALEWAGLPDSRGFAVQPSLAADLNERAGEDGEPGVGVEFRMDEETVPQAPPVLPVESAPPASLAERGADAPALKPVYNISGIPHPLLAGAAVLLGVATLVSRRDKFA